MASKIILKQGWLYTALVGLLCMGAASAQQVQIDRYRGSVGIPGVPAPTPFVLPNYVNLGAAPPQETGLSNLLAFAADSSNLDLANHTTRANFPILETDALPLSCADIALTPDACARQLKGLVAYTLVKFPADGVYQFAAGFDDRLQLAVANANSVPANFRDAAMYTEHHRFTSLVDWHPPRVNLNALAASPFTVKAGVCVLVRATLNNGWGGSRLRLGWRYGADLAAQAAAVPIEMPSGVVFDPTDPASYADCMISAADQSVALAFNTPVSLPLPANAAGGPMGGELQVTGAWDINALESLTPPQHGTVTCDAATGGCTYNPAAGFSGTDTFSYKICLASPAFDGSQVCDIATVTVTVAAPSTPPAIAPVPVGHPLLLAVLAALMAGMCALRLRR